jgi:lipopolysaccharide transport system ATP-binding protein
MEEGMKRIVATGLGKRYQPYPRRLTDLMGFALRGGWRERPSTWALRDVSFEIDDGESVGVIGMNGAGKSTLLRILTGTTIPSEGRVEVNGQVAALLELGLGMHADLTGQQNATLACELMGLDAGTIRARLPCIQAFAELGAYMDQPVRTYSAGMQLRLAFSAATAVRPDVLIVDEVLAVGDAYFQVKCLDRIRALQQAGMTLILVTHDLAAVKTLCARTLLLDQGHVLRDGPTAAVLDYYNALIATKTHAFAITQTTAADGGRTVTRSGTKDAEIITIDLIDADDKRCRSFDVGARARLAYRIRVHRSMEMPTVGFLIRDRLGVDVFGTNTAYLGVHHPSVAAGAALVTTFDVTLNLGPGRYSLAAALHRSPTHLVESFDWWDEALTFTIVGSGVPFTGVASLPAQATIAPAASGTATPVTMAVVADS